MRCGVVGSSGGSAFLEARALLEESGASHDYAVVTDRPCGIEARCAELGIPHTRIEDPDNRGFSEKAAAWFAGQGDVGGVLLYFLRLVTGELFCRYPTFNIHPSLLPAFAGFQPLRRAREARVRFLGATLHLADASTDGGPIVAQTCMPIASGTDPALWSKYSFIQKVYLTALAIELLAGERMTFGEDFSTVELAGPMQASDRCNPLITDPRLLDGVLALQQREGVCVIG